MGTRPMLNILAVSDEAHVLCKQIPLTEIEYSTYSLASIDYEHQQ